MTSLRFIRSFSSPRIYYNFTNSITICQARYVSTTNSVNSESHVIIQVENGIRKIRLNRTEKKNAFTQEMYTNVGNALKQSNDDNNTRIVVITGTGDYFTSGNDLANFLSNTSQAEAPSKSHRVIPSAFPTLVSGLIHCKKPVVALVNGSAIGIGVTLLGLCDTVYASDRAMFSTPFSILGLSPECCSSYTFPRVMGYTKANEILAFNAKMTAQELCDSGLVSKVFPHDSLETEGWKRINEMAKLPIKSLIYSKELVRGELQREFLETIYKAENNMFDNELVAEQVNKIFGHKLKKK